jgi:hypothetical protein
VVEVRITTQRNHCRDYVNPVPCKWGQRRRIFVALNAIQTIINELFSHYLFFELAVLNGFNFYPIIK